MARLQNRRRCPLSHVSRHLVHAKPVIWLLFLVAIVPTETVRAEKWLVPVAGNAFPNPPSIGRFDVGRNGLLSWSEADRVFSIYFHVSRPAELALGINARVGSGRSTLTVRVGSQDFQLQAEGAEFSVHEIGRVEIPTAGYVRVDLQGSERSGETYAEIRELVVTSEAEGLVLSYVKSNEGNMFYWGRRGPSVHLRYEVPADRDLQYAYSEITIPPGQDTIGSFFMANGFREGYFGFQVNDAMQRRILFSVWSPFQTNDPRKIPADQRIETLAKGQDVHVGEFGNEGSGGQSFLVHPWKAGTTYRFLTEIKPDAANSTVYTAWFGDPTTETWRLIASFRRPQTETYLRGFHSFLENFNPSYGHIGRRGLYGNVWVCDTEGRWHECTTARFSVDATGGGHHRLDFTGGTEGDAFFLQNCGFLDSTGKPGETFHRQPSAERKPEIAFDQLPRS